MRRVAALVGVGALVAAVLIVLSRSDSKETQDALPSGVPDAHLALLFEDGELAGRLDRVALVSSRTGEILRVVVQAPSGSSLGRFSLAPDRETLYVSRATKVVRGEAEDLISELLAVDVATGAVDVLGRGSEPAISPDGKRLAYVGPPTDRSCQKSPLVVRTLASGAERTWRWAGQPDTYECLSVHGLAWGPDARDLVFVRNIGDPNNTVRILDTAQGDDILDSRLISPADGGWNSPTYKTNKTLWVTEARLNDPNERYTHRAIIEVDPESGTILGSPVYEGSGEITSLDLDSTGALGIIAAFERDADGSMRRTTYLVNPPREPIRIGGGALQVAW